LSVNAYAMSDSALVTWEPPASDGGTPITAYKVMADPLVGDTIVSEFEADSRVVGVGGLTGGVAYTMSVIAVNEFGESAPTVAAEAALWTGLTTKPRDVVAVGGNTNAVVSWSPPESVPIAVQSYTVRAQNLTTPSDVIAPITVLKSPMTFPGLTNLSQYTFTVVANNEAGASPASDASVAMSPVGPPSPPSDVLKFSSAGIGTLNWLIEPSDSPIVSYTLVATPSSGAVRVVTYPVAEVPTLLGSTRAYANVAGLTNGVEYTMSLFATSAGGNSTVVVAGGITPLSRPSAPTITSVTTSNGQAVISWTAPSDNGGTPVTGYSVEAQGRFVTTKYCATTVPTTTCTISGLENNVAYYFVARAENEVGLGGLSNGITATPLAERPSAPSNIVATASLTNYRRIVISWDAPNNNGALITRYNVKTRGTQALAQQPEQRRVTSKPCRLVAVTHSR
jgi:hypothetical protein